MHRPARSAPPAPVLCTGRSGKSCSGGWAPGRESLILHDNAGGRPDAELRLPRNPFRHTNIRLGRMRYYAEGRQVQLPFTNYAGLVEYLWANGAQFVYREHRQITHLPFLPAFRGDSPPRFEPLHRGADAYGAPLTLYAFSDGHRDDAAVGER